MFVNAPVETVNRFLAEAPNAAVQLHGEEDAAYIASLRQAAGFTIPQSPAIGQDADDEAPSATETNDARKTSRPSARNARIIQAFRIRCGTDTLKAAASAPTWCYSTAARERGKPSTGDCSPDFLAHFYWQAA